MVTLDIKGIKEEIITRSDYPMPKCREILKNEVIAILGYGPQGRGQALNLKDNGFNVCVGVIKDKTYDNAVKDGWTPGCVCALQSTSVSLSHTLRKDLLTIEEAAQKGSVIQFLISDAGQKIVWPSIKQYVTKGKAWPLLEDLQAPPRKGGLQVQNQRAEFPVVPPELLAVGKKFL